MTIGYDKHPLNHQILLDLPFREGSGNLTHDRAKPHHILTKAGGLPSWALLPNGLSYLNFHAASAEWLECPAVDTADLNFTSGDFSGCAWLRATDFGVSYNMILCRGDDPNDGWWWNIDDGVMEVWTSFGMSEQTLSVAGAVVLNEWGFFSFSRQGASVRVFKNGRDNTDFAATHPDPLTANRKLHIGIHDNETFFAFDGDMWRPRLKGRYVTELEWLEIFNRENRWFGV